jgi:hypothetical protein
MGGSGKSAENTAMSGVQGDASQLSSLASQSAGQSQSLFNLAFPGMQQAESMQQTLASGDPYAIAQAVAPATQQVAQATQGAQQNIMQNAPDGGEKNLALEQSDVSQGAQVGNLASQGYLNSFNNLAQMGQSGVNASQGAMSNATGSLNSANSAFSSLGNMGAQEKGATLGAIGGLTGTGMSALSYGLSG